MEINLTHAQWLVFVPIVKAGERLEKRLGVPLEIDNGNQKIEIGTEDVKITLED